MNTVLVALFLTPLRRLLSSAIAILMIAASDLLVVKYLDFYCDHPGLALLALFVWVSMTIAVWWIALMALSPQLILPTVLSTWMEENALESDLFSEGPKRDPAERLEDIGLILPKLDPYDPRQFSVNAESRFRHFFILGVMASLLITHFTQDHFLTRFQRVGLNMTYLRSDDSLTRLKGLNLLVDAGRYRLVTQNSLGEEVIANALETELLKTLKDTHEGVRARAAFVTGLLHLKSAVPQLEAMAQKDEVLREVALLSLGAMPVTVPNPHPAHDALKRLSQDPQIQQSQALALAIAVGRQRVAVGEHLVKLYQTHLPAKSTSPSLNQDQKDLKLTPADQLSIRQAAVWSLGELRDTQYLTTLDHALRDPELSVRCLAAVAFEKMIAFESSPYLKRAFESSHRDESCPQVIAPTQEGVKALVLIEKKSYQLALMRALATTDDPSLLKWMEANQDGIDPMASRLLYKYYKALEKKEKSGLLDPLKRRLQRTE